MPTPFTDAPDALLHLWNKFALSGDLDGSTPPATMQEAYNQVVAIQLRQMREGVQAINEDVQHLLDVDGPGPPTCCVCGASPLIKYVASLHTGATYCPACVEGLEKSAALPVELERKGLLPKGK